MNAEKLLDMSPKELDELFHESESGDVPNGIAKGTALIAPGSPCGFGLSKLVRFLAWQGKTFDSKKGVLINRILPFGVNAVEAKVYKDASWMDKKDCIALDYSKTSILAKFVRDEIRLVDKNFYLGKVYVGSLPVIHFCLEFNSKETSAAA
jgi:hypothetical protein